MNKDYFRKGTTGQVSCPYCKHKLSTTLLTQGRRRRRLCCSKSCGKRFTTYEVYADHLFKQSQEYEEYLEAKVEHS